MELLQAPEELVHRGAARGVAAHEGERRAADFVRAEQRLALLRLPGQLRGSFLCTREHLTCLQISPTFLITLIRNHGAAQKPTCVKMTSSCQHRS